jgi:hypothetical protein
VLEIVWVLVLKVQMGNVSFLTISLIKKKNVRVKEALEIEPLTFGWLKEVVLVLSAKTMKLKMAMSLSKEIGIVLKISLILIKAFGQRNQIKKVRTKLVTAKSNLVMGRNHFAMAKSLMV